MNNLTLSGFFDPLPHGIWVVALWNILPSHRRFRKYPCPSYSRESEGPCSSAGVQGAGPLASAERAASPSAEGWREVRREEGNASQCITHRNAWFPSSLRESGNSNDGLSMQLWRRSLSIEDFFTPLVIEGDQEVGAYLAETPL